MTKKFKTKRNGKKVFRMLFFILIIFICYLLASLFLFKMNLNFFKIDQQLIKYMINDTNHHLFSNEKKSFSGNNILTTFFQINLNKPASILKMSSSYLSEVENTNLVYNENYEQSLPVIKEDISSKPLVYIYNTHPTETFEDDELNVHNIEPNIRAMSDVLKEKLEQLGVSTIVEQGDVTSYLKEHNYNYNYSYSGSKYYLERFLKENSNVKLYIDLHRDGTDYKNTVTTINNKKYAKVMFVLGGASSNYQSTLDTSNKINNYFKKNYPTLTRGIFERKTSVFNQDLEKNMVLIELGGNENNLTEVLNTIDILAEAIKEYIYEN